jgi:hypothetical protein
VDVVGMERKVGRERAIYNLVERIDGDGLCGHESMTVRVDAVKGTLAVGT